MISSLRLSESRFESTGGATVQSCHHVEENTHSSTDCSSTTMRSSFISCSGSKEVWIHLTRGQSCHRPPTNPSRSCALASPPSPFYAFASPPSRPYTLTPPPMRSSAPVPQPTSPHAPACFCSSSVSIALSCPSTDMPSPSHPSTDAPMCSRLSTKVLKHSSSSTGVYSITSIIAAESWTSWLLTFLKLPCSP